MENVDNIHFNMPEPDVMLLNIVVKEYRGLFKEECETGRRLDKIINVLDNAINYYYFKSPEKKEKEEQ